MALQSSTPTDKSLNDQDTPSHLGVQIVVKEHWIPIPNTPITLYTVTHIVSPEAQWLIFCNSLTTNVSLWSLVAPSLTHLGYNLILFDQRGHGRSSVPSPPTCTMEELGDDVAQILDYLGIQEVLAAIGVSQGGAAALAFAMRHLSRTKKVVACDTQATPPAALIEFFEQQIELARTEGMGALARQTVSLWFPVGSPDHPGSAGGASGFAVKMVENTPFEGFVSGVRALETYDLLKPSPNPPHSDFVSTLFEMKTPTLLLAGSLDVPLPDGLQKLAKDWNNAGGTVAYEEVPGCGHLPMLDGAEKWFAIIATFLK